MKSSQTYTFHLKINIKRKKKNHDHTQHTCKRNIIKWSTIIEYIYFMIGFSEENQNISEIVWLLR